MSLQLKISSPEKVIFNGNIKQISIPTESGEFTILPGHAPMVSSLKPGIIKIIPEQEDISNEFIFRKNIISISVSKWMIFVDGKKIHIVTSVATTKAIQWEDMLRKMKQELEEKIRILKQQWSLEEIEKSLIKLEKINADIKLEKINSLK